MSSLRRWAAKAEASAIEVIVRFVRQLKKDWTAVENAVEQVWGNGPTEGHINRLKTLKRGMYGRAGVELLRARLLPLVYKNCTKPGPEPILWHGESHSIRHKTAPVAFNVAVDS